MKKAENHVWTKKSGAILEKASVLDHYNRWILSNFKGFIKGKFLEVGAGLGGLAKHLPQKDLYLSDLSPEYLALLKKETTAKVFSLDIEKESPDKYHHYFDSILSSNVFEHIGNDARAFKNCFKLLKSRGSLLVFVPACPEIYGTLDHDLGHFRRYTLRELKAKAETAGFIIKKIRYVNLPGYFLWWGRGVLLGKVAGKSGSSATDKLLAGLFDLFITPFLFLEKFLNLPFGQSLVLIAQKP